MEASTRWAAQLVGVGCKVDGFDFSGLIKRDGQPVKDLNDCSQLSDESINHYGSILTGMMDFLPKKPKSWPKLITYVAPVPATLLALPSRYWNAEELKSIQGTGLEDDDVIEQLAKNLGARILVDQIRRLARLEIYATGGTSV